MNLWTQALAAANIRYTEAELLKDHTTFQIGGPADIMVYPVTVDDIRTILKIVREFDLPFFVLGNGSNVLFSDKGLSGIVMKLGKNFSDFSIEGNKVHARSGAFLSTVTKKACKAGLGGAEFATGIPGSVGGAIVMNAGAYDGEMKDIVSSVTLMDRHGTIHIYTNEEMHFGYRTSRVLEDDLIVLEVVFELKPGEQSEIDHKVEEFQKKRTSKQPLDLPSAGSTFKRPPGYFAGKLIEDSGLRGFRFRGAQVSSKHCGFVVNTNEASAEDVSMLIRLIQRQVKDNFGIEIEPEIKIIGRHDD